MDTSTSDGYQYNAFASPISLRLPKSSDIGDTPNRLFSSTIDSLISGCKGVTLHSVWRPNPLSFPTHRMSLPIIAFTD